MKVLFAISGASGAKIGLKAYELLPGAHTKFLIVSDHAKIAYQKEESAVFDNADISAPPASGSFGVNAMLLAPCSVNTLAKIACGIADNLITRAASVMIKERRKLLIAPRELPFDPIALENMLKLSQIGVIIAPPVIGYYAKPETLEDMEKFVIGKWFDLLGIENSLYRRWGSD
ncbi:flavin prenyltransferase UbiX [Campylobacterota bacterium]|nr:flavin prenyltransferase UbiX [Campylobacterota bacterium]